MYGGRVRFTVPMHYAIGFMLTFVIGGLTGVLLAIPPVDFVVHNSLFLVAHFHQVIIGGVVFAVMAGYTYWFPKAFGFTLDERLGKAVFWCWFIGFHLAFMPLLRARLLGRRRGGCSTSPTRAGRRGSTSRFVGAAIIGRRDRADRRPAALFDQDPRPAARRHRRPVGRPDARMADPVAAAALQFRGASRRPRRGSLLDAQADRDQARTS